MARWNGGPWVFSKEKRGTHRSLGEACSPVGWQRHGGDRCCGHGQARKNRLGHQGEVDGVGVRSRPGFREPFDGRRQAWVSVRDEVRIPIRAAANRQGRQVTTATPAALDLRVTGVTDEGCADTMSARSPCSMALATSSAQGCLIVFHLQAPESQGCIAQDWALCRWHVIALRLRQFFLICRNRNATEI